MDGAHFELCSCNTNNDHLQQVMQEDGCFITYGCDKARVAPLKECTLPQLKLLGALLALRVIESLLITFKNTRFRNLYLALDAQVVLGWLTSSTNFKSVYASNRIKDAKLIINNIEQMYHLTVQCKYVPTTTENPGDLLTRGLTLDKFRKCLDFWIHGPTWMRFPSVV